MSHIAFSLGKSFNEEDLAMLTGVYMACCKVWRFRKESRNFVGKPWLTSSWCWP